MLAYTDFEEELCRPCAEYSAAMQHCSKCSSDGTKVTCTECASGLLASDGSACLLGCKIVGEYLDNSECETSCTVLTTIGTDEVTCIDAAVTCNTATFVEYLDNNVCYFCDDYPNIDTTFPYMRNCAKCTAKDACIECKTGYILRNDFKGCVTDCSKDDSTGATKYISASALTNPAAIVAGAYCMIECKYAADTIDDFIDATVME